MKKVLTHPSILLVLAVAITASMWFFLPRRGVKTPVPPAGPVVKVVPPPESAPASVNGTVRPHPTGSPNPESGAAPEPNPRTEAEERALREREEADRAAEPHRIRYRERLERDAVMNRTSPEKMQEELDAACKIRSSAEEKTAALLAFLEKYPASQLAAEAALHLADHYRHVVRDPEKAVETYREILRKYPDAHYPNGTPVSAWVWFSLGTLRVQQNRIDEAREAADVLRDQYPDAVDPTLFPAERSTLASILDQALQPR